MNLNMKQNRHTVDMLFTLSLFAVFAVTSLMLVFFGTQVYENIAMDMESEFTSRTAISYIKKQINQNNALGAITVGEVEGTQALIINESLPEGEFKRYIFLHDGYLCELFTKADITPTMTAGQRLLEISLFEIEHQDNLYTFTVADKNNTTLSLALSTL